MTITDNSIFNTSEILYIRIETIKQRINKLEFHKTENKISSAEERELAELYAKNLSSQEKYGIIEER